MVIGKINRLLLALIIVGRVGGRRWRVFALALAAACDRSLVRRQAIRETARRTHVPVRQVTRRLLALTPLFDRTYRNKMLRVHATQVVTVQTIATAPRIFRIARVVQRELALVQVIATRVIDESFRAIFIDIVVTSANTIVVSVRVHVEVSVGGGAGGARRARRALGPARRPIGGLRGLWLAVGRARATLGRPRRPLGRARRALGLARRRAPSLPLVLMRIVQAWSLGIVIVAAPFPLTVALPLTFFTKFLLLALGCRHLGRVLFSPFRSSVLEPYLGTKKSFRLDFCR